MSNIISRIVSFLLALATASPVLAAGGSTTIPEGSALTLFALGILGVIIGRRGAMRPKERKNRQKQGDGES